MIPVGTGLYKNKKFHYCVEEQEDDAQDAQKEERDSLTL